MMMLMIFKHIPSDFSAFSFGEFASKAFCTWTQVELNNVTKAQDRPLTMEPSKILCFLQLISSSNLCLSNFSLPLFSHY